MPGTVTHQHLLRSMDALKDNAEAVEEALARQIRLLVDRDLAVVFYDLITVRIHGEGEVGDDLRVYGMNKETGGNAGESKTLQGMLQKVLARFPVQHITLVADRGLPSLDNIKELSALADQGDHKLEFILAVPARRCVNAVSKIPKSWSAPLRVDHAPPDFPQPGLSDRIRVHALICFLALVLYRVMRMRL